MQAGGRAIGTLRFEWSDPYLWPHDPDDAGYVHSLATRNSVRGHGIGAALLEWAKEHVRARGRSRMRLDCWGNNAALCAYYERLGFTFCRQVEHPRFCANLYEMLL